MQILNNTGSRVVGAIVFAACLTSFPASGVGAPAPQAAQLFKGEGTTAAAVLGEQLINGNSYSVIVDVITDQATDTTTLLLRLRQLYTGGNRTDYWLQGTIPSVDFSVAADLSSATLNTVVNSTATDFNDPDVGSIVGLTIDLTWSATAIGKIVDNEVFDSKDVGSSQTSTHEIYHSVGPHADCTVDGSFAGLAIAGAAGSLDKDANLVVYQTK
jgi:hypothetical protein